MSGAFRAVVSTLASIRTYVKGQAVVPSCDTHGNLIVNTNPTGALAASAADATANPTLAGELAYVLGFNGTTWDRLRTAIVAKTATVTGILNTLALGRYNLTPPALTDGDVQLLQLDANGAMRVSPAVAVDDTIGVIKVEHRYAFSYIPANATTVVKTGAGFLHTMTIGTIVATATITVYDNTSAVAPIIALITLPAAGAGDMPQTLTFDIAFTTGLTVVTSGTTPLTLSYR